MKFHSKQSLLQNKLKLFWNKQFEKQHLLYNDGNFKSGSHDDHLYNLDDLIVSSSQEFDSYEDPHTYSHKITIL